MDRLKKYAAQKKGFNVTVWERDAGPKPKTFKSERRSRI